MPINELISVDQYRRELADQEKDVPGIEERLAVPVSWEAVDALFAHYEDSPENFPLFKKARHFGPDLKRLFGDAARDDTYIHLLEILGDDGTWAEHKADWASFREPRPPRDTLLVDELDAALARGCVLPAAETAAVERFRDLTESNRARRVAAEADEWAWPAFYNATTSQDPYGVSP